LLKVLLCRAEVTVKCIFDYWFDGIPSLNYQPFRFLRGNDRSSKASKAARSRAAGVIGSLLKSGNTTEAEVGSIKDLGRRDRIFEDCFLRLFRSLYPGEDDTSFDRRRIGDLTYLHVYDLLHPKVNPPAKRRRTDDHPTI